MSFVPNEAWNEQTSLYDSYSVLTERGKKFLNRSWAKYFAEEIFPRIEEEPYRVLYSSKDSRPNTPVNVQIGALILKELTGLSDEELMNEMMFDVRYQYALHTTGYAEQPMSDRTLGRFRERCSTYEKETGIDLLKGTILSLSREMAELMRVDSSLKRMDSMMVASNIKRMSRLELLYTCTANLAKEVEKQEKLPEELEHYTQADDRNRVIYHNHSEETDEKIAQILKDMLKLKKLSEGRYDESSAYQLLLRVIQEQTIENEDGSLRLRTREDGGMDAKMLQNPADPDATYREKAGKQNRGYVANVVETSGENGSVVVDYQYEQNICSDSQFLKDYLEQAEESAERQTLVTDGAYSVEENEKLAAEKNIELITTNLTGRETPDIMAEFEFNEDGTVVTRCPGGQEPKSCSYNQKTNQCTVSFHREQCEQCPYRDQCQPKQYTRTFKKVVSTKAKRRAEQQRKRKTAQFSQFSNFRNGVESIPSILRRKYNIDRMPVRGLIRSKLFFACKLGALNFKKFCKYMQGLDCCAQIAANA